MSKNKLPVQVSLQGKALQIVLDEQKKYTDRDIIRGKGKLINQLLTELYEIKNKSSKQIKYT